MTRHQPDDRGEVILYRIEGGRTALDVVSRYVKTLATAQGVR
jgi:hypothetical protein